MNKNNKINKLLIPVECIIHQMRKKMSKTAYAVFIHEMRKLVSGQNEPHSLSGEQFSEICNVSTIDVELLANQLYDEFLRIHFSIKNKSRVIDVVLCSYVNLSSEDSDIELSIAINPMIQNAFLHLSLDKFEKLLKGEL